MSTNTPTVMYEEEHSLQVPEASSFQLNFDLLGTVELTENVICIDDTDDENEVVEIKPKETETVKKQKKKQSNAVKTASRKRKSQINEEPPKAKKQKPTLERGNRVLKRLTTSSLGSLRDVEMRLVCIDETEITFEFPPCTHSQTACRDFEEAAAPKAPNDTVLRRVHKDLQTTLQEASNSYRQKNYKASLEQFSTALELCGKGTALKSSSESCPEDISSIASFIETKLVLCCLKLRKTDEALNHAHRSIILNPYYFRNHLRQAAAFRCLQRYSEATRSAMIAHYMYCLTGGTDQNTSNLIKQYWQALLELAVVTEKSFTVMYTPVRTEATAPKINTLNATFAEKHPGYKQHIYTDPDGHILPRTTVWQSLSPKQYSLTLGFKDKNIGKMMERWSTRKVPIFSERKVPFSRLEKSDAERFWDNVGKNIVPVMDFIRSTKLTDVACPCARGIEKLHYANILGRMHRLQEQTQVINQAMAELATLPYLQDISQQDVKLLQSLMADAMDILDGRTRKRRAWNKILKVGLIENYLYEAEEDYLNNRNLRQFRKERKKRNQNTQPYCLPGNSKPFYQF